MAEPPTAFEHAAMFHGMFRTALEMVESADGEQDEAGLREQWAAAERGKSEEEGSHASEAEEEIAEGAEASRPYNGM